MTPLVSFAITTHNEGEYIQRLLDQLIPHCAETGDEIVILDDYSTDSTTLRILKWATEHRITSRGSSGEGWASVNERRVISVHKSELNRNFAEHKNRLNSLCMGTHIFQIDADETLHPNLLENLHWLIENNQNVDLFVVPRVNTVEGLTDEDIKRWGWRISKVESQTDEKMIDTGSDEYKMLKKYGLIIEETAL